MQAFRRNREGQGKRHSVFEEPVARGPAGRQPPPSLYGPVSRVWFRASEVDDIIDDAVDRTRPLRGRREP